MTKTEAARTITDSRVLAAMAHPLRRRLLDALKVDGPSTASMLANRTGQAIGKDVYKRQSYTYRVSIYVSLH